MTPSRTGIPATGSAMTHQALVYGTDDELQSVLVPFVRDGLSRSEPVLAILAQSAAGVLEAALGDDARHVEVHDAEEWYRSPARALSAYERYADERSARGTTPVRVIGQPRWLERSEDEVREWALYESMANAIFSPLPLRVICLYDTRLSSDAAVTASLTHPQIIAGTGRARASDRFVLPADFARRHLAMPLDPPPAGAAELRFSSEWRAVRRFVAAGASSTGLPPDRVSDLQLAANEVATNVHKHAGGHGVARLWADPGWVRCQIEDRGPGIGDPFGGYFSPSRSRDGGWGLWLSRQLCDLVQVRSTDSGTTVRLHVKRP